MLSKLRAGERAYDGGTTIDIPIEHAQGATGGSFKGLGLLNTSFGDIITQAEYEWRQYYSPLGWSRRDYLINKGSKQKIVDMVASITRNAGKTMSKNLTTGIFQSTKAATDDIDGLLVATVAASTTDCGGLSSTDITTWAAQRDTSTTKLSLAALNNLWRDCSDGPDQPTIIVSTDDILGFFYDISTPLQRYQNESALKAGFEGVMTMNGVPFYADKSCTANQVFMLNLDHLWLAPHQDENMRKRLRFCSAMGRETLLKFGESLTANPEPSDEVENFIEGVETRREASQVDEGIVQTANYALAA